MWVIHSLVWLRGLMGGSVAVMAIAGMVFGSLPVLGMILRCCLAFGFSFVARVGDSFLGFASWLDRLGI